MRFKRVHHTGTEAVVTEYLDGWPIQIYLRETKTNHNPMTITGYLTPTVERAHEIADQEILKYGHLCNEACKDWVEVPLIVPFQP
jgi:hypothetical protein